MDDNRISGEMIRGHIDTIILLSLVGGDRDSNEIRNDISEKSGNKYSVKQGTFYSAIARLVKQNYIREYRSSAVDGIRRKYYALTDKGNKFLDKNRSEWNQSKEIIDDLIDTPSEKVKKELPKVHSADSDFESFKMLASDIGDFKVTTTENSVSEDYLASIGEEVLSELNRSISENEKLDDNDVADNVVKDNEISDISTDFDENYETLNSFNSDIENSEVELNLIFNNEDYSTNKGEYEQTDLWHKQNESTKTNSSTFTETTENENLNIQDSVDDDFLYADEEQPVQREYKSILNRLFPKEESVKSSEADNEKSVDDVKQISVEDIQYVEEEKFESDRIEENKTESLLEEEKAKQPVVSVKNDGNVDFSDLYDMAKREGFKIRTSFATNKTNGDKILINKLRSDSSLLFYIVAFVEMLILAFSFNPLLNFSPALLIVIPLVVFVLPLVFLIMRLIDSDATVSSVPPFRNVMEVVLVVTFQLLIIILGVALFVSVDFNNYKELVSYIVIPSIFALNVPLYFMIKYMLLNTERYFKR